MAITIRARVALQPGAQLRYDPPGLGDSSTAAAFFNKNRGRSAIFVAYAEKFIGVLDLSGRRPGRYVNQNGVRVQFDGENEVHELYAEHLVIIGSSGVDIAPHDKNEDGRLGDLPHPIHFFPDDVVRFKNESPFPTNDDRHVREVFVDDSRFVKEDGLPRYSVLETPEETAARVKKASSARMFHFPSPPEPEHKNVSGEDLELVRRGNVWALYEDPSRMGFFFEEAELNFWTRRGVGQYISAKLVADQFGGTVDKMAHLGVPLSVAYRAFEAGAIDAIQEEDRPHPLRPEYMCHKLLDVFAEHKQRVRALTERVWRERAMVESA